MLAIIPARRRSPAAVLTVAILVAGLAGACGQVRSPAGGPAPGGATTTTPAPTPTPTGPAAITPAPTTTRPRAGSALTGLAPFFAAVRADDARITAAARAINADIGRTTIQFRQSTIDAVKASFPSRTTKAFPAGLTPKLLRAVLLVYNDLVARSAAFNPVKYAGTRPYAVNSPNENPLWGLRGGAVVARRFPGDLAAARSLAAASPPIVVAAPSSRAAAEVMVRMAYLWGANSGCGSAGGQVFTRLVPLVWKPIETSYGHYDGTIGGVKFRVTYRAGQGWKAGLDAC